MNWHELIRALIDNVEDDEARFNIYKRLMKDDWSGGDGIEEECFGKDSEFDLAYNEIFGPLEDEDEEIYEDNYDDDDLED